MATSEQPQILSTSLSIREAAQHLGVSERTVYRWLRAGKLKADNIRTIAAIRDICDNMSVKIDRLTHLNTSQKSVSSVTGGCQVFSDNVTDIVMQTLMKGLEQRDLEIGRLIESQREMNQTVQRLQEQMFELTRLVLAMNLEHERSMPQTIPVTSVQEEVPGESRSSLIRRWIDSLRVGR